MEASGAAAAAYAYRSVPQALSSIVRTEGPLALWRGLAPALLSNVPFSALHYAAHSGHHAVVHALLHAGADATIRNSLGN